MFCAASLQDESALLVREAVQNSWDAAREFREEIGESPPFEVAFRLFELTGAERERCITAMGLRDLVRRLAMVGDRRLLGLDERDCLMSLEGSEPLRMLEISERAAGGMHGPWRGEKSKLFKALCTLGITPSTEGRGGSFGYGKAGMIRSSAIRTVVAYTCFAERPEEDPGCTRRLLGMTYWGSHDHGDVSLNGARWLARRVDEVHHPYEDSDADRVASQLGIATRDPSRLADHGSTFMLVDPTVNADDLRRAAERFWWPALEDGSLQFEIVVIDESASGGGATASQEESRFEAVHSNIRSGYDTTGQCTRGSVQEGAQTESRNLLQAVRHSRADSRESRMVLP